MSLNRKIDRQVRKMPKYKIQQEAFDTQNIARSRAFGRDRSIQAAQEDVESDTAAALGEAKDITTSSSALLAALGDIYSGGIQQKRQLASDEAGIQRQNVGDLYQANQMMIDEKDKAWYHNKFAPWEAKLTALQQKKANRTALWSSIIPAAASVINSGAQVVGGLMGGK